MMWGISSSGSRYPLILAGLSTAAYFLRTVTWRAGLPIAAVAVGAMILMAPAFGSLLNRFAVEGSGERGVKTALAIELMATSPSTMLLGARLADQDKASRNGVGLSDNSIAAVVLSYGIPVALLLATGLGIVLALTLNVRRHLFMLVYGAGVMVLHNGIYWDLWLLYWLAALYAMQPVPSTVDAPQRHRSAALYLKEAPNAV